MRKLASVSMIVLSALSLCACKQKPAQYNGYIDADLTYLSSDFPGKLSQLLVKRGESVTAQQFLFRLEQVSEHLGVSISRLNTGSLTAQREQLLEQRHYAEINYHRTLNMQAQHAASQNDVDLAKKDLEVLIHQLTAIEAQIKGSELETANKDWQMTRKAGYAPHTGLIFDTYFTPGEYVQAGQPILSLITPQQIKVVFFVPETALSQVHLNQGVHLSSDGNSKLASGSIRYISNTAQYTPPIIYSREQRQALVFRVEAGISSPDLQHIHLGQPVSLVLEP